jgi:hypothetical protein
MEVCENCGRTIGKLETAHLYQNNIVCSECNSKLQGGLIQSVQRATHSIVEPHIIQIKPVFPDEIKTNVKQGAANGAAVCLLLAWAVAAVGGLGAMIVFAPLFLAAFILSIVAMAQKRIGAGLTVMILTLISAPGFTIWSIADTADSIQKGYETANARIAAVPEARTPDQTAADTVTPIVPPNPASKIKVSNTAYCWLRGQFNELHPILRFDVYNGHNSAIQEIKFTAVLKSPGRTFPWVKAENSRFPIDGGIEPGETKTLSLAPYEYDPDQKKWWNQEIKDRRDLLLDIFITDVVDAK